MRKTESLTINRLGICLFIIAAIFAACKKEKTPEAAKPQASSIEIGTANNKRALKGRDFHFNADVVAGDRIKDVSIKIVQKAGASYSAAWKLELGWPEYKGAKNTNVHKHFLIPAAAPEGKYDFIFTVSDENGTQLEVKETLDVIDPANIPVDPKIGKDKVWRNGSLIYDNGTYIEKELQFGKGDEIRLHAEVENLQGDGILYSVLVKKSLNYHPESPTNLDLSKVIVVSKIEHANLPAASKITTLKNAALPGSEAIIVGVEKDNNEPAANFINGSKSWESGAYNWVLLYQNTSHQVSVYKSIPVTINYK